MKSLVFSLITLTALLVAGCGGGGSSGGLNLTGSLTLTAKLDTSGGTSTATATAVYTNPTKDSTGVPISFIVRVYTASGDLPQYSFSETIKQTSGGVSLISPVITQMDVPIYIDITVSTGDLQQFQRLVVPEKAVVPPLTVTPLFPNFSTAATKKVTSINLTIAGAVAPYTISSTPITGVTAGITGSTLTLLETIPYGNSTGTGLSGTVTIKAANGATFDVLLTY